MVQKEQPEGQPWVVGHGWPQPGQLALPLPLIQLQLHVTANAWRRFVMLPAETAATTAASPLAPLNKKRLRLSLRANSSESRLIPSSTALNASGMARILHFGMSVNRGQVDGFRP